MNRVGINHYEQATYHSTFPLCGVFTSLWYSRNWYEISCKGDLSIKGIDYGLEGNKYIHLKLDFNAK